MNDYNLTNIPSITRKDFGFRSLNKSESLNSFQDEMLNDILDLFNKANTIEQTLSSYYEFVNYEARYLETAMNLIKDNLTIDTPGISYVYPKSMSTNMLNFKSNVSLETNDISLSPTRKTSKISIFDEIIDMSYIPKSIAVQAINRTNYGPYVDTDLRSPLINNNQYWCRKITTNNEVSEVIVDYILTIPNDIITSNDINEIIISPFVCNIVSVDLRYGDSATWIPIESFGNHSYKKYNHGVISEIIKMSSPIRINFKNFPANQIRIRLSTKNYVDSHNNSKEFMLGIKNLSVNINKYEEQYNEFQFSVEIPSSSNSITNIKPDFNNINQLNVNYEDIFSYDIFYELSPNQYQKVTETLPFNLQYNKLLIKCKINSYEYSPNIHRITIEHK